MLLCCAVLGRADLLQPTPDGLASAIQQVELCRFKCCFFFAHTLQLQAGVVPSTSSCVLVWLVHS